ncbi:hypothetical protein [Coleofasciculus sp.]
MATTTDIMGARRAPLRMDEPMEIVINPDNPGAIAPCHCTPENPYND